MSTLLAMYIISGLILAALSIPLILRRIPPNGLYGFRVKQTLDNPSIWYSVNEYAGKRLLVAGLGIVIFTILLSRVPDISLDAYALACLGVITFLLAFAIIQAVRYLKTFEERK